MTPITVNERTLIRRINRKLAKEYRQMKVARKHENLGRYYLLDTYRNEILNYGMDLENFGREMNCLNEQESLAV